MKGKELERQGYEVLSKIGLEVANDLDHVEITEFRDDAAYSEGEHLEVDYLVPTEDTLLVGEITGRSSKKKVKGKLDRFIKSYRAISEKDKLTRDDLLQLGVEEDEVQYFLGYDNFKAFFITNKFSKYEINLNNYQHLFKITKNEWNTLSTYSRSIGVYGKNYLLSKVGISSDGRVTRKMHISDESSLSVLKERVISDNIEGSVNLYSFDINPYDLMGISEVKRRDNINFESVNFTEYQRPLDTDKLESIRKVLNNRGKFTFPNNIICSLSHSCLYAQDKRTLIIPEKYGSISILDGQHRLFSYASKELERNLRDPIVRVTAIDFKSEEQEKIDRYSAFIFLEINSNQDPVEPEYLDVIAYDILNDTSPSSIAFKVLMECNHEDSDILHGMFDIYDEGEGILPVKTIKRSLDTITDLETIVSLSENGDIDESKKKGYENLLMESIDDLTDPDTLVEQSAVGLRRYFNHVSQEFQHEWPSREGGNTASLLYRAKAFAGFIRFLWYFIENGYDWREVQEAFSNVKSNVMDIRDIDDKYYSEDKLILDQSDEDIPDADNSPVETFRFLRANIDSSTSIKDVK